MWTRIRPNLLGVTVTPAAFAHAPKDARLHALRVEVEQLSLVRSNVERATQLARVLDAVSVLAEAHGLSDAELHALRGVPVPMGRATTPFAATMRLRQQLKERATGVVAQVWSQGPLASISELAFGVATPNVVVDRPLQSAPAQERVATAASKRNRPAAAGRSPFVLRVGAGGASRAAGRAGMQLIAASLLHLPRLHRQLVAVRRGADIAMQGAGIVVQGAGFAVQTAKLMRLQASNPVAKVSATREFASHVRSAGLPPRPERTTAASLLLWSGRSSLQLTYEIATAGAQLILRRYVLPRVLRYLSSRVIRREIATARPLRPLRTAR